MVSILTSTIFNELESQMRLTIPNQLTLLRIILTPLFVYLILLPDSTHKAYATAVFVLASFTDWYDGWHARRFGVITRSGQFLDPLADKILVSSALIAFAILNFVKTWMVWIIIARDALITINRIYALNVGKPIITHVLAKWKTALQMLTIFGILVFINYRNFLQETVTPYEANYSDPLGISMLIVTLLTIISGVIYIYENRDLLSSGLNSLLRRKE